MTLLAEDPELWDTVFSESPDRARFIKDVARATGTRILDVGCATGSLCRLLRESGTQSVGVDINPHFIAAARTKDPDGEYVVGDMRRFRLERKFDLLVCLGTTFSYNRSNKEVQACLRNFRRHVARNGCLILDVLNAIAFTGPQPFRPRTRHAFKHNGTTAIATISHRLDLKNQLLSEQVSWKIGVRRLHQDPAEELRMFFPQELMFHLQAAGFPKVTLMDGYGTATREFTGRRLIAVAAPARVRDKFWS